MKQKFKKPTKVKQQSAYQTNSALSMESQSISPVNNGKLIVATNISTEDLKVKLDSMIDCVDDMIVQMEVYCLFEGLQKEKPFCNPC